MSVKAGNNANSRNGSLPKSLEEIDKHFSVWNQSTARSKTKLKQKSVHHLNGEGIYAKQACQQLKDFGKLYQRKVKR